MGVSRRKFLTGAAASIAAAGMPQWFADEANAVELERDFAMNRRYMQNDKINVAVIGPGGSKGGYRQGLGDTRNIGSKPGVKVVAVCDVDSTHRDEAAKIFGPDTKKYSDYRELLANKEIDAVVIGTPDHWHATIAIAAMTAGKDVYCEKPLTLTIDEGKRMVKVARDKKRILQTGSQQRSDARFRLACELVRNGRLGKISRAVAHLPTGPTGGPFDAKPIPEGFDFDFWLGPAAEADYFPERTHGNFRWFFDYSGGMMTDWGAHHNDISQWGLGMDGTGPVKIEAKGVKPKEGKNCYTTFPEFDIDYTYANGVVLHTTNKGENGVDFIGDKGTIFVSRGVIRASDEALLNDPLPADATKLYNSNDHAMNFVECIRTRKLPICDVEIGHRSVTVCHLGNIALRLGKTLEWDPVKEVFKGDKEANALLKRPMRKKY